MRIALEQMYRLMKVLHLIEALLHFIGMKTFAVSVGPLPAASVLHAVESKESTECRMNLQGQV